ncbi:MAG: hypothetical protein IJZ50_07535 [Alistipes sp.]|nr:hypothetical protein [Alistipes sp.]
MEKEENKAGREDTERIQRGYREDRERGQRGGRKMIKRQRECQLTQSALPENSLNSL